MPECSKCGSLDYPFYTRLKVRENGKRTKSTASYCVLCHAEDQKIREERRYPKKLAYNRIWRKNNRDKVNASNRKSYAKSKNYGFENNSLGSSLQEFSTMKTVPLYVDGRR